MKIFQTDKKWFFIFIYKRVKNLSCLFLSQHNFQIFFLSKFTQRIYTTLIEVINAHFFLFLQLCRDVDMQWLKNFIGKLRMRCSISLNQNIEFIKLHHLWLCFLWWWIAKILFSLWDFIFIHLRIGFVVGAVNTWKFWRLLGGLWSIWVFLSWNYLIFILWKIV